MLEKTREIQNTTIVCVSAKFECGLLIREARRIADETNTNLFVINVQKKSEWGKKFSRELDYLLKTSKGVNAEMTIFFSDSIIAVLKDLIERENVSHIVIGNEGIKTNDVLKQLCICFKEIEIHICKY